MHPSPAQDRASPTTTNGTDRGPNPKAGIAVWAAPVRRRNRHGRSLPFSPPIAIAAVSVIAAPMTIAPDPQPIRAPQRRPRRMLSPTAAAGDRQSQSGGSPHVTVTANGPPPPPAGGRAGTVASTPSGLSGTHRRLQLGWGA